MTGLAVLIFAVWLFQALDLILGILFKIPALSPPSQTNHSFGNLPLPKVSIIFAARKESGRILEAARSMLPRDYPDFEVIAGNDRSSVQTRAVLESISEKERLKIVNIQSPSSGWLGKNYALYQGCRAAKGEWLLFTDADVCFDPALFDLPSQQP